MIIRWMPNCHEERYAFGLWGALLSLMLNCYARGVYYSIDTTPGIR
jgi:hypothetical protein